jgi:hypothetical protein
LRSLGGFFAAVAVFVLSLGCDAGTQQNQAPFVPPPASVHIIASNVSGGSLPANGSIQLAFDRLLLPASITRQTFVLSGNNPTPNIAYDPVTRVVTITPLQPLTPGQTYELGIASPQNAVDMIGLRAIDGATLAAGSPNQFSFLAAATSTAPPVLPMVDFCADVYQPVFMTCNGNGCHGTTHPAEGLYLGSPQGVADTAIGRVAHGSNTGPRALPEPPSLLFPEDMPLIDPGNNGVGNPGDSYLLYKLLMAHASGSGPSCDAGAMTMPADAGATMTPIDAGADADATIGPDASSEAGTIEAGGDGVADAPSDGSTEGALPTASDAGADAAAEAAAAAPPPPPGSGNNYAVCWQPLSPGERATLANLVQGREMPYPTVWDALPAPGLSIQQLENVSLWIEQGASIPPAGCP